MNDIENIILQRLDKIEKSIVRLTSDIQQRVAPLESFKYKIVGITLAISVAVPFAVAYITKA